MEKNITIGEVTAYLDATFHPEYQEDYDNAGFLLGDSHTAYRGALVALDLTPAVIKEAVEGGFNLIVTHHPFIFSGLKRITDRSESGRMVMELLKNGISVYAAHTNLDNLPWGVNGALAKKLKIKDCRILKDFQGIQDNSIGAGMVGDLLKITDADMFLRRVKLMTKQPSLRTSKHDPKQKVKRVAICGGAGAFLIPDAIAAGADIFITSDLKYHDFQRGEDRIILVDAGHYETERWAKEIIYSKISEKFSTFACRISENQGSLVQYI